MHNHQKAFRGVRIVLFLLLAFLSGILASGIFRNRQESRTIGELNRRYTEEHERATEIIGRLTEKLERERELNRELREHNVRAREIAGGLAGTAERNVRNLQEAVGLIGEIRKKIKILADFYSDSGSDSGGV